MNAAHTEFSSLWRVNKLHRIGAKPSNEFLTAEVWRFRHLENRRTDREKRARRQVGLAQVHLDKQLVACKWPTPFLLGHKCNHARVHDGDLQIRMRAAVGCFRTTAQRPVIAYHSLVYIQHSEIENFTPVGLRSTD